MRFKRTSRLVGSAAVTAGLAFGGLSLAAPAADAATSPSASASYTCTSPLPLPIPGLPSTFQLPATFSLQNLPGVLTANLPVPAGVPLVGQLDFSATGLLPSVIAGLQSVVNLVLGNIPGASAASGPLNTLFAQLSNGAATITTQLGSFTPGAGALPIPIPTSFDIGTILPVLNGLGIKCALNAGSVVQPNGGAGIVVSSAKLGAKVKAHAKAKPGHRAVVTVKVKASNGSKAVGSVKIKAGGVKKVVKSLSNGKVHVVLRGLKVGKSKIKVTFLGNAYTNAAKKKVSVRIAH